MTEEKQNEAQSIVAPPNTIYVRRKKKFFSTLKEIPAVILKDMDSGEGDMLFRLDDLVSLRSFASEIEQLEEGTHQIRHVMISEFEWEKACAWGSYIAGDLQRLPAEFRNTETEPAQQELKDASH